VFYVAAQWLDRLPPALSGPGRNACVLVLPKALAQRPQSPSSFEVAGCRGYAIRGRSLVVAEQAA